MSDTDAAPEEVEAELTPEELLAERKTKAHAMIKAVYDDQLATINGRDYKFLKCTHKKRVQVFAFFSEIQEGLHSGKVGFLSTPEWAKVETVMKSVISYDNILLNQLPDHWEAYPQDYMLWMQTALSVLCFPLLPGSITN